MEFDRNILFSRTDFHKRESAVELTKSGIKMISTMRPDNIRVLYLTLSAIGPQRVRF